MSSPDLINNLYDFYKILEVPRDASLEEIKKAYRYKAKLVHPDVNDSPKANEVFAVVREAYAVLTDDQKRYLHDVQLNQLDSIKAGAGRKKQYYGASVKTAPPENPPTDWSFERAAYRERTEEEYYRRSPFFYNLFFATGTLIGFIIIFVMINGTIKHYWAFPFGLISISGFIIVREGFRGLLRKKSRFGGFVKLFRK